METYERIKFLRTNILKITQQEFADKLKVSRSNLASIEIGRINVTDRVISDIEEKFSISKEWLLHGTGDIKVRMNKQQEIAKISADLFLCEETSFKYRLFQALSDLDANEWALLEKILMKATRLKD